ncbi:pyruvate kinase [candidate division SR1 bacterium Aalborg_AAW-1]|nr:pyruvate kinase [candidate division SR1 bacterium Aalborg_AAW-1]
MSLKFIKAGVAISSTIAKETILSKIINTINMFSIDIANKNFDDLQRKYIDTILKLDDSKTIMLETKGEDISVKNMNSLEFVLDQTIYLEYSSILEDDNSALFINYAHIDDCPVGTIIGFMGSEVQLKLVDRSNELYKLVCVMPGSIHLGQKIFFHNYNPKVSFLSERDKKNVIWGIQSGVNVLSAGSMKSPGDVEDIRIFLNSNNGQGMKLYARLSQKMVKEGVYPIVDAVDGVVVHHDDWSDLDGEHEFILSVKNIGKPVIIVLNSMDLAEDIAMINQLQRYVKLGVDIITISEGFLSESEAPLENIQKVFSELALIESQEQYLPNIRSIQYKKDDILDENNYLIDLLPKIITDTEAKIVLCYTTHGRTAAKISALGMSVPLLIFTRDDFSYRYNNLLWGVKGYKIGQTSTYEMFKQIGKEMIRIYFKGNISLDDKVVIVNILEDVKESVIDGLINGIELYKFKNI